jgi:DNA-binding NarL/FixJ family response regulator
MTMPAFSSPVESNRPGTFVALTPREVAVLTCMAEGLSNAGIGARMYLSPRTVEVHVGAIFDKLGLTAAPHCNRRVLAVLTWLAAVSSELPRAS